MVAPLKKQRSVRPRWHAAFLGTLPIIVRHLRVAFRHLRAEAKEETIAEALANACTAYQRLVKQGRAHLGFPTVLARFAQSLSIGNSTSAVARRFRISPSRISQLRRQFYESWQAFCGGANPA